MYRNMGWKIIPIYPKTKIPVGNNWNLDYDENKARKYLEHNPNSNLGILLGDIVDVEGDTPEANAAIERLVADIPHPCFRSKKSSHHLFLAPVKNFKTIRFGGVEIRGRLSQSLLPPSIHADGETMYEWDEKSDFRKIPVLPKAILNLCTRNNKRRVMKPGFTRPYCEECKKKIPIHQTTFRLEKVIFEEMGIKWRCNKCRKNNGIDLRNRRRNLRKSLW